MTTRLARIRRLPTRLSSAASAASSTWAAAPRSSRPTPAHNIRPRIQSTFTSSALSTCPAGGILGAAGGAVLVLTPCDLVSESFQDGKCRLVLVAAGGFLGFDDVGKRRDLDDEPADVERDGVFGERFVATLERRWPERHIEV